MTLATSRVFFFFLGCRCPYILKTKQKTNVSEFTFRQSAKAANESKEQNPAASDEAQKTTIFKKIK